MHKRFIIAGYRLGFGLLTAVTLVAQYVIQTHRVASFSPANYFSFFTIESNILAAIVFLGGAYMAFCGKSSGGFERLRGAATLYMVTTGLVYIVLLSGLDASLQTAIPWINFVLHYLMPVVALADWLIDVPAKRISFKQSSVWLIFPVLYMVYSLVRGPHAHWYPYPFMNPRVNGYAHVAISCVGIAVVIIGLSWLLAGVTRWLAPRLPASGKRPQKKRS